MTEITVDSRRYKHTCKDKKAAKHGGECTLDGGRGEEEWGAWNHSYSVLMSTHGHIVGINYCP